LVEYSQEIRIFLFPRRAKPMGRFVQYNANPQKNRVGDCTVRAISKAFGMDWNTTYVGLCLFGFMACDMPTANAVWGNYLKAHGFRRYPVDDQGLDVYTVDDFARDHPDGIYVLALDNHVVTVCSGCYFDTWDSGQETPIYYWKREDDT
jgi:hypothetical protein